jgi:hypothetical protein
MYISLLWVGPPGDVSQLLGRHSDLAARPVVFVIPLRLTHPDGIARGHGLEHPLADRFLRKANIKLMRPPVRDIDKSVKVFLQQLARIGFQVAPLVVVREALSSLSVLFSQWVYLTPGCTSVSSRVFRRGLGYTKAGSLFPLRLDQVFRSSVLEV